MSEWGRADVAQLIYALECDDRYNAAAALRDLAAEVDCLRAALATIAADAACERYPDTPRTPDEATTGAEKELVCIIDRMSATALAALPEPSKNT